VLTESVPRKRWDYRAVGREKGRSIHSFMEIVVEGILLFSNTVFKVSIYIQITVISTLVHKQNRCQGPPRPLSPPDKQIKFAEFHRYYTGSGSSQTPQAPRKTNRQTVEFYAQVTQNYKFPIPPKAALFAWGGCTGHDACAQHHSKCEPGFSVALHHCESSARENNSSWEEACAFSVAGFTAAVC